MNINPFKQRMVASVLAAGLVLAPLPALQPGVAAAASASAQTSVMKVFVDGVNLTLPQAPTVKNGATLVPMRAIFGALRANVTWDAQTKTVLATKGNDYISLKIGSAYAVKNGASVKLQTAAEQKNGTTLVPLRFVAEALGAEVSVDAKQRVIRITSDPQDAEEEDTTGGETEAAAEALTTQEIVAMNDEKVVMITTDQAQGSGVVVGGNLILTNYHVVASASKATVALNDNSALGVKGIVAVNEAADLALIQTESALSVSPVQLASPFFVEKGSRVVTIGSPLGFQNTAAEGLISNITYEGGTLYYQTSAPIDHGSSGGAMFNESGELLGITTSKIEGTSADLNFAVSVRHVLALLQEYSMNPKTAAFEPASELKLEGATTEDIRKAFADNFGTVTTTEGTTELKNVEVTRDASGWLVINAVIDSSFYMLFGDKTADDLRYWAIDAGAALRKALPNQTIQLSVYYQQEFNFEPRGFASGEVTKLANGKWQVRYPVVDLQENDKMYVRVRT
ncbi:stalk domain-containing protein [Paenibacillus methanolicus]|uniref:Trypsin-like peptidase n=1 Tax=Paenibacillus methanolicus TaxID=582686 RepID=A0A5S5BSG1_9BACL|nr:stalk domain-containing protein [Paenibacillus methanolicus]TYP70125.1 trypsin-like peptidase [Paenibacillus methanolicus]